MKKIFLMFSVLPLCMLHFFSFNANSSADSKKVLMIVASNGFRDEEFKVPLDMLTSKGYEVVVASSSLGTAKGMLGMSVEVDISVTAARPSDYEAIIFVGGVGAQAFWDDVNAQELAKSMNRDDKLVAAICIAPVTLANAGILEGKNATVWKSESHRLESKGVNYTGKSVEVDGNIITGDGPSSAEEFAQEVIKKLEE